MIKKKEEGLGVKTSIYSGQLFCKENSTYVFLFWELRGLYPNFHIHVSVSHLYIPRIGPHMYFHSAE